MKKKKKLASAALFGIHGPAVVIISTTPPFELFLSAVSTRSRASPTFLCVFNPSRRPWSSRCSSVVSFLLLPPLIPVSVLHARPGVPIRSWGSRANGTSPAFPCSAVSPRRLRSGFSLPFLSSSVAFRPSPFCTEDSRPPPCVDSSCTCHFLFAPLLVSSCPWPPPRLPRRHPPPLIPSSPPDVPLRPLFIPQCQ